ncbi:hypothetical protein Cgig2_007138 [Carnegiea gigantea]|uniref:DUF8040 domain-containing protein n=1 Tax=Carnegiea gigantea TaxID=171969 RepID=A0A9Q1QKI7_9CARY|nr:hypothetical protein Cgig2_007138 [Carnegiea gigantea]
MENHHEQMNRLERFTASIIALYKLQTLLSTAQRIPMRVGGEDGGTIYTSDDNWPPKPMSRAVETSKRFVYIISSHNIRFIEVAEQVRICLYILSRGASYRQTVERFQNSISTISKYFLEALEAQVTLSVDVLRPYHSLEAVSPEISNNGCYHPFFRYIILLLCTSC